MYAPILVRQYQSLSKKSLKSPVKKDSEHEKDASYSKLIVLKSSTKN
jgi:hypothetical protein